MALTATVARQAFFSVDATSFTTASTTPVSGALYVAFVTERTNDAIYRTPTVSGTNGWNTTWTRVPAAQSIYLFNSGTSQVGGVDVFWGIAASGTAGTITTDYGTGTNMNSHTIHLIQVGGNVNTVNPIGGTASDHHSNVVDMSGINTKLTRMPARNSLILACGRIDLNAAEIVIPGPGFTILGATQDADTGLSTAEFNAAPTHASVGIYWNRPAPFSPFDIMSISAVEIVDLVPDEVVVATAPVVALRAGA